MQLLSLWGRNVVLVFVLSHHDCRCVVKQVQIGLGEHVQGRFLYLLEEGSSVYSGWPCGWARITKKCWEVVNGDVTGANQRNIFAEGQCCKEGSGNLAYSYVI